MRRSACLVTQYEVYPNLSPRMQDGCPFVVDIQSDLLKALATRMVVPLAVTSLSATSLPRRLCPVVVAQGQRLMLVPFESAPLDKRHVKAKVSSVRKYADDIVAATDAACVQIAQLL